ncbi:hypothetical protein FHS83_002884 [Rhizomicrobium palustre]|uniref:Uncharacterized protein n=1 Tax=Rhizomicrobium palustre TaxID=189966 RepID=A0A846N1F3_9PROT|nr:hypothetical protein [Rhizomicrobium palustre]NIK89566.1 hypothetical protein [Rhizomicrobium palustre]
MWAVVFAAFLGATAALVLFWARIALSPPARWTEARVRFLGHGQVKGDFGELLTAAILTQQGWRQLPSKIDAGGHGIDGLFIRRGLIGWRVLITETKCNASSYRPAQLETAKLIRALGDLYAMGALDWATSDAIIRALKWRSPRVRKELWRHHLHIGHTTITRTNRLGVLNRHPRKRDTAALMESLAMMIGAMDREGRYVLTAPPASSARAAASR